MNTRILWISVPVAFLAMSVALHVVLIIAATSDPGFAVEPDYERKAADFDSVLRQRTENERLGWSADLRTVPGATPGEVDVMLQLVDREGTPVQGAAVELESFHLARAARILRGRLEAQEEGGYGATLPIQRSGVWEFRLSIVRGEDRYTETFRKSVLSTPRAGPSRS